MGLILLEALAAGLLLVLIVWWTMFSGRKGGELHDEPDAPDATHDPEEKATRQGQRDDKSRTHTDV
ncbi:MAG: hypothetical protein KKC79_17770 [Gammaproteobacteria bacterium]|nr:hypothetical protein [Gammaproteobacteria bacterium]MBU1439793.1 hypothetical protein [Gammaproteobacteria bacterium]MBU2288809.1 hypothetical protein [Gammaproteobacteria bacterium]MBU2410485.1 hypothetical protein [Gammaproteobacteria bacterium]